MTKTELRNIVKEEVTRLLVTEAGFKPVANFTHCPFCSSKKIHSVGFNPDNKELELQEDMTCQSCGRDWQRIYKFSNNRTWDDGTDEYEEGEEEN